MLPLPLQHPSSDGTGRLFYLLRAVSCRHGRHTNFQSARISQADRLPGGHTASIAAQALRGHGSCQSLFRLGKISAASRIKIIAVLVMAEQDGIHPAERGSRERWRSRLAYHLRAGNVLILRRLKCWIGQEAQLTDLNKSSRAADVGDT